VQGGQSLARLLVVRFGVALVLLKSSAAGWSGSIALGFPVGSKGHQVRLGVRGWRVVKVAGLLLLGRCGVSGYAAGRVISRLVLQWVCGVSGMWVFDRSVVLWACGVPVMWVCGTAVAFVTCFVSSRWA
jgi:hypothetical protein